MWKKIRALRDRLYCSRAFQTILPGSNKDKAGKKLLRAKHWRDAEKYYDQLLKSHPKRVLFLERAATAKLNQGKYADAETIFSMLAENHPGVSRFALRLAEILLGGGRSQSDCSA